MRLECSFLKRDTNKSLKIYTFCSNISKKYIITVSIILVLYIKYHSCIIQQIVYYVLYRQYVSHKMLMLKTMSFLKTYSLFECNEIH